MARKKKDPESVTTVRYFANLYRDSVTLMQHSAAIAGRPGVVQASLVMATAANLDLLSESGLIDGETEPRPNDVLLALEAVDEATIAETIAEAERILRDSGPASSAAGAPDDHPARSLEMGLSANPAANLALISCPGEYAAAEAEKALRLGLDVMIFSDNVSLDDEVRLKTLAAESGRLVMGPDCGTAIVQGVALGFANKVARGTIGIAAASGTGLQQVACLLDNHGAGVSHALGTGGRDLSAAVGGVSMMRAIELFGADAATEVLVLVSKPPSAAVAARVLDVAAASGKPVVVNFLGSDAAAGRDNLHSAATLADAAHIAIALANGDRSETGAPTAEAPATEARFAAGQQFVRGLYSGGTFCYEAQLILRDLSGGVHSSTPVERAHALADPWASEGHTVIDLGEDLFTRGRPHPMIDHRLRNERILREAADPQTAVILLDVVLGYGSHPDPAAEMTPVLREARAVAAGAGRGLVVVGFVCGTEGDPQGLARQEAALRDAGVIVARHNAEAVRWAAAIATRAAEQGGDR